MKSEKRFIDCSNTTKARIEAAFGCSRTKVWRALNYRSNDPDAERMRQMARGIDGVEMVAADSPNIIWDYEGCFRQYMPNGTVIEGYKGEGGKVSVLREGRVLNTWYHVSFARLGEIQAWALNQKPVED